jgi:DNA-binding winged helix-turn-helix (wHTH) protein
MPENTKFYKFFDFTVDASNKVLQRNGATVSLTPKVFDTLFVLIENHPNLVEKEELMKRIWQDRFVEEGNLAFNIKVLRRALGDSAAEPQFIETVPRRGYRFIAEVREIAAKSSEKNQSNRSYFALAAVVIFIGIIAFGAWLLQKN